MTESRVIITAQAEQAIREFDRLAARATGSLRQVGELGGKLDDVQSSVGNLAKLAIGGFTVGAFVGLIKGSIDALDSLKDLSVTTKIAVEDLSGLKLAAEESGADLDSIGDVIAKLSTNIGKNGEKFRRLGVTSKEPLEAFKQFSDVFKDIEDPQLQAAFAADAVGRSWKGAAPLLSEGSKRIGEMIEKGRALSGVTAEMADQADEFNDQLTEMNAAVDGAKMKLASEMLPALTNVTKAMMKAHEESGKLHAIWVGIGSLGAFAFTDEFSNATTKIKNLREELSGLETDLDLSKNSPAIGFIGRALFGESTDVLEKRVGNVKDKIKALQAEVDRPGDEARAKEIAARQEKASKEKEKAAAEAAAKAAAFLQLSNATDKASADAGLALRRASIESEKAQRGEALASVAEMHRQGLASDAAFYLAKRTAALDAGTDTARIKSAEIAALRNYNAKDAAEQVAINGKIAVLSAEKNEAMRSSLAAADLLRQQYIFNADAPARAAQAAADAEIATITKETAVLEDQVNSYGKLPAAITAATIAKLEAKRVALETNEGSASEIANVDRLIVSLKERAIWEEKIASQDKGSDLTRATELLAVMTSLDDVTRSAADGMAASFGKIGSAIGGMTTALTGYARTQAAISAELASSINDAKHDPIKIKAAEAKASQAAANAQIRQYGDMAVAAKGFFKENSKGYNAMEKVERAFRAVEMAMAVESMLTKSGMVSSFLSLFVASKSVQTGVEVTSTGISTGLAATEASAWGITAVVKAIASLPFPWNLAAGAATLAAVIAVGAKMSGGSSGGGKTTFEEKQKAQGTGTVLGDETAKSESMAKSLEILENYASLELEYQSSMLTALRNIESALGGAAKNILQTTGITGGSAFGTMNSSEQNFFGSDKSTTILDSGVKFAGTFGALRAGRGSGKQYEDVSQWSDGGMFHGDKTNNYTNTKALTADAMKPFALIFDNMGSLLVDAGVKLGKDGGELTRVLNALPVDFSVSLRNLKGQELTDALNAGVSVAFDKVTKSLFPTILQFQKMGEGLGETLVRVATDVKAVDSVFAAMGKSTLVTIRGTTETFGGTLRAGLVSISEMSIEAKERLVEASGGLDKFASAASSFMKNFYSDAEQQAATKARLAPVLAPLGLSTEGAGAQKMFKDFVLGLDVSTAAGASTYAMLMSLQQAFKDVTQAAADERADLLEELDELTMTQAQLAEKARRAVAPSNLALYDQVALQRRLKEATTSTTDALKSTVDGLISAKASTLAFRDSLLLGSLSTLTPMQKYLETQRQYAVALAKANANPADSAAQSGVQSAATAFLTASQVINASSAAYVGDKSKVLADMTTLASIAGAQLTDAQLQLSRLDAQVTGLATLNQTAVAIEQAIRDGNMAPVFDPQRYAAAPGTDAMAAEVKSLRAQNVENMAINAAMLAELRLLRGDAARQADQAVDAADDMGKTITRNMTGMVEKIVHLAGNPTRVNTR